MFARFVFFAVVTLALPACAAKPPQVLVTIKPLYVLVKALMKDVAEPQLLLDGTQSPHDYALRPSDAQKIADADIIIYASRNLESFIEKPLGKKRDNAQVIEAIMLPGVTRYPYRVNPLTGQKTFDGIDPHFWLDPASAVKFCQEISRILIAKDPANREIYESNLYELSTNLLMLDLFISDDMAKRENANSLPIYLTYHDAFQYFEKGYHLPAAPFLTHDPEQPLSPKTIEAALHDANQWHCIFEESAQHSPVVEKIHKAKNSKVILFEPEGVNMPVDDSEAGGYRRLLADLSQKIADCSGAR